MAVTPGGPYNIDDTLAPGDPGYYQWHEDVAQAVNDLDARAGAGAGGSLAPVATSGDYSDLINTPALGTSAATDATDYATAAQGALADTAVQPGGLDSDVAALIADDHSDTGTGLRATLVAPSAVLRGSGIDPSGVSDSLAAVQAKIDALAAVGVREIRVQAGDIIALSGKLTITTDNLRLVGPGELRWTAGISNNSALHITGDNVHLDGLTLTNPNELQDVDDDRPYGVEVEANDFRMTGCTVDRFQQPVAVRSTGEWARTIISNNIISNVLGVGGGADDLWGGATGTGENRGDGIVTWGCLATITGNIVYAKDGMDCRVGIHTEGLPGFAAVAHKHADSMFVIANNVIYGEGSGSFRRGIANEVDAAVVTMGNTISDCTWDAIRISGQNEGSVYSGNTIIWTRTSSDLHGDSWSPERAVICAYAACHDVVISNNVICIEDGAHALTIFTFRNGSPGTEQPTDVIVQGNIAYTKGTGTYDRGFYVQGSCLRPRILDNTFSDFETAGIELNDAVDAEVRGNRVYQSTPGGSGTVGIKTSSCTREQITGNISDGPYIGIQTTNPNSWVRVNDNSMSNAGNKAFDLFNTSSGQFLNNFIDSATVSSFSNTIPTTIQASGNLAPGGADFSWSPSEIAAGGSTRSSAITLTGASSSDALVVGVPGDPNGLIITAYCSAGQTGRIAIHNPTASPITPPSGTYRVKVVGR